MRFLLYSRHGLPENLSGAWVANELTFIFKYSMDGVSLNIIPWRPLPPHPYGMVVDFQVVNKFS